MQHCYSEAGIIPVGLAVGARFEWSNGPLDTGGGPAPTNNYLRFFVRNAGGTMVPFSSFGTAHWTTGPIALSRYNGYPSLDVTGRSLPEAAGKAAGRGLGLFKVTNGQPSPLALFQTGSTTLTDVTAP